MPEITVQDLGQEAGSSQLPSFRTVHHHSVVWVLSLPLNLRLSTTPVLALRPSFPLSSVYHRGDLCTQSPFPHSAMSLALASVPILPRIKIPVTGISCPSTSHRWPPPASLKGTKAPWEGLGVQVQELQLLVPMWEARGSPGVRHGHCGPDSSWRKAGSRGGLGDTEAQKQAGT